MQWRETAAHQPSMSFLAALRVLSAVDPRLRGRTALQPRRRRLSVAQAEAQIRRDSGR